MSDDVLRPDDDPALDAFVADAVFGIDSELDEDMAAPDLAAVVALAKEMDPSAVPDGWLEEAAQWAPVITLREGRRFRQTQNDPAMAAIVAQVRAVMDHEVGVELAQRNAFAAVPTAAAVTTTEVVQIPQPKRHRGWYLGLAAAALLLVGGAGLISAQLVQRQEATRLPDTAVSERLTDNDIREADVRDAEKIKAVAPTPELEPEPEPEIVEPDLDEEPQKPARRTRKAPKESRQDRLARLDTEARAAWKAKDLRTARTKFEKIVAIGGKHRLADLAFGDLFTLARQSGNAKREARLWKDYLRRFPSGRFADDAQAGLCRRSSGNSKSKCWERYLRDMPRGAYRAQAQRELKSVPETP